jgi:hypothetical protein
MSIVDIEEWCLVFTRCIKLVKVRFLPNITHEFFAVCTNIHLHTKWLHKTFFYLFIWCTIYVWNREHISSVSYVYLVLWHRMFWKQDHVSMYTIICSWLGWNQTWRCLVHILFTNTMSRRVAAKQTSSKYSLFSLYVWWLLTYWL